MAPLGPAFVALGCALAVVVAGVPMHRIMDFFHPRRVSAFSSNYEGGSSSSSQAPQLPPDTFAALHPEIGDEHRARVPDQADNSIEVQRVYVTMPGAAAAAALIADDDGIISQIKAVRRIKSRLQNFLSEDPMEIYEDARSMISDVSAALDRDEKRFAEASNAYEAASSRRELSAALIRRRQAKRMITLRTEMHEYLRAVTDGFIFQMEMESLGNLISKSSPGPREKFESYLRKFCIHLSDAITRGDEVIQDRSAALMIGRERGALGLRDYAEDLQIWKTKNESRRQMISVLETLLSDSPDGSLPAA